MKEKINEVSIKIVADGKEVSCYDVAVEDGFDPCLLKTMAIGLMERFKQNLKEWPEDLGTCEGGLHGVCGCKFCDEEVKG